MFNNALWWLVILTGSFLLSYGGASVGLVYLTKRVFRRETARNQITPMDADIVQVRAVEQRLWRPTLISPFASEAGKESKGMFALLLLGMFAIALLAPYWYVTAVFIGVASGVLLKVHQAIAVLTEFLAELDSHEG